MAALLLRPTPSRIAYTIELLLTLLAVAALWISALPDWLNVGLSGIAFVLVVARLRQPRDWQKPVAHITLSQSRCLLKTADRVFVLAPPCVTFYSELLIALLFESSEVQLSSIGQERLLLWPDSLTREEDRRLRCYLQGRHRA